MVALMSMTPVHLVHGGATLSVVGFTISLHIAGMFALSPVFGVLADHLGRIPTIVLGQLMLLASAAITALGSHQTSTVMLGLILLGLGWSASTVAGSALLNDAAPADRRVPLQGRSDLVMNLAGAVGGAASGPMLAWLGYPGLAWSLVVPVAAVLAALLLATTEGGRRPVGGRSGPSVSRANRRRPAAAVSPRDADVLGGSGTILNRMPEPAQPEYLQPPVRADGPIRLADPDPEWPARFAGEEQRIRVALGSRAVQVDHVGSTSVPGLAAKPVIDIVLVVADSADEAGYLPDLEAAGYRLQFREPDWYEHRFLRDHAPEVQVHVFSVGCPEVERMLLFRDHVRSRSDERELYERTKRELAARRWEYIQDYADAKSAVIEEIILRARASRPPGDGG